jgi:RHS repeat-associated protein
MKYFVQLTRMVCIIAFTLSCNLAKAVNEKTLVEKLKGADGDITLNNTKTTIDNIFHNLSNRNRIDLTQPQIYTNRISLEIDELTSKYISNDFIVELKVDISYYKADLTNVIYYYNDVILKVTYNKNQGIKYDALQYFVFKEGYKVTVRIDEIMPSTNSWALAYVSLYNKMDITRDYKFNPDGVADLVDFNNNAPSFLTDELEIHWNADPLGGCTHYDIEWVWIDAEEADDYQTNPTSFEFIVSKTFNQNISRITIPRDYDPVPGDNQPQSNKYRVPLLYDGNGYLVYRVRAIQYRENGQIMIGKWSATTVTSDYYHFVDGHEPGLNWQATTNYAEDGKRKSVIQYFDGSLRSRQTVTKESNTNTTLVAETMYDFQGRAAIQILPTPTLSNVISYAKNFNRFQTNPTLSNQYEKEVYDIVQNGFTACNNSTPPLISTGNTSTIVGSGQYYSEYNPLASTGENQYIPSASGYPYTETVYTPDGTNRVQSQSGVGIKHRMGSGKETKYFYGSAKQKELDGLFGPEVGEASHYFKNMVRDANGQYSVSYVDMNGKTIATALAGVNPSNLLPLPSLQNLSTAQVTESLLSNNNNIVDIPSKKITMNTSLLVPKAGYYTFNYTLNPQSADILACNPPNQTVCYDCLYDLIIRITDNCGVLSIERTATNLSFGPLDQNCNNPSPTISVAITNQLLEEGEYNITKILTISQTGQDRYKEEVYKNKNLCKTQLQFYNEIYQVIVAENNCEITCASCRTNLGTYQTYRSNFLQAIGVTTASAELEAEMQASYNQRKEVCDLICGSDNTRIQAYKNMMLQDMSPPFGQFAIHTAPDVDKIYNIFKPINNGNPPFLSPLNYDGTPGEYKNSVGQKDLTAYTSNNLQQLVFNTKEDFLPLFKQSWAEALLPYHPEYCKFEKVKNTLMPSYQFDQKLERIYNFAEANSTANPTNVNLISGILNGDPFFNSAGLGSSYKIEMKEKIENSFKTVVTPNGVDIYSMWQIAWMTANCRTEVNNLNQACGLNAPKKPPFTLNACSGDWNKVWTSFRTMYLSEKAKYVNKYLDEGCYETQSFYNGLSLTRYRRIFGSADELVQGTGNDDILQIFQELNSPTPTNTHVQTLISQNYQTTCESYKQAWKDELLRCDQILALSQSARDALINDILNELVDICKRGSDANHVFGSSSEVPNDPNSYDNFSEAIAHFFDNNPYGSPITISAICHPFLISYPKPYDKQQPVSNYPAVFQNDPCVCDRLAEVRTLKAADGYNGTLSEYIQYKFGVSITQSILDKLQNGCDGNPNCESYDPVLSIPGFFACGSSIKTCIDCEKYNSLVTQFHQQFPSFSNVPHMNPANATEVTENVAFESYMNYHTGFAKTWMEYWRFGQACENIDPQNQCPDLQAIVTQFHITYPNLVGQACRDQFVIYFNQITGYFYTWPDILALYLQRCGSLPDVCNPSITCIQFEQIIYDFYDWYMQLPLPRPDCKVAFLNFFNSHLGTDYTDFQQVADYYQTICHGELRICIDEYPCLILMHVLELFRETDPWTSPNCIDQFVIFFNDYFGTNFDYGEIHNIYLPCLDRFNFCDPPISCENLKMHVEYYNVHHTEIQCISVFPPDSQDYCADCFVQYMNSVLNYSYSYSEWMNIFINVCGAEPNLCTPQFTCTELTAFVQYFQQNFPNIDESECWRRFVEEFNSYFNVSYNIDAIKSLYLLYCRHMPSVCGNKGRPSASELNKIVKDFKLIYPNPVANFGIDCQIAFVKYFNSIWGSSIEADSLNSLYINITSFALNVCDSVNCSSISQLYFDYQTKFGVYNLPIQLRKDLLIHMYKKAFDSKEEIEWSKLLGILNYCGINPNFPSETYPLLTCSRILGIKKAFLEIHSNNLPDNTAEKFAAFVSFYFNTKKNYKQVVEWGLTQCNLDLDITGELGLSEAYTLTERRFLPPMIMPPRLCGLNTNVYPPVNDTEEDPCEYNATLANNASVEQYNLYVQNQMNGFDIAYRNKCLAAATLEQFTVTYTPAEYHYTLYYYDNAGNLVKTIPPEGVHPNFNSAYLDQVNNYRKNPQNYINNEPLPPSHTLATEYRYNTLGQVVSQRTPDAGMSRFYYDKLGRLVLSQNAKQATSNQYSYTIYDQLGRIKEVGQKQITGMVNQSITQNQTLLENALNGNGVREQITFTEYDFPYTPLCDLNPTSSVLCQQNLRNRVSHTYVKSLYTNSDWDAATFYSYDIHGNVQTLLQDYKAGIMNDAQNRFKKIEYKYDLISGKVNEVAFQPGKTDAFYHRYEYDAENRLLKVETSTDHLYWERDAAYKYYKHGPLSRTVLGYLDVQGIDYAYTLQGWLKGVNSTSVSDGTFDIGRDGKSGSPNEWVARDAFGFSLNYFASDYTPVSNAAQTTHKPFVNTGLFGITNIDNQIVASELFNGNIASMFVNIPQLGNANLYGYKYDQLNRIRSMDMFKGFANGTNTWTSAAVASADYKERVQYDANGNILSYLRQGAASASGLSMDQMTYQYERQSNGQLKSNKLRYVYDNIVNSNYPEDIESQTTLTNEGDVLTDLSTLNSNDNFAYDPIGNLIKDTKEGISQIEWNVYGKIKAIHKGSTLIQYTYDASGNRISKKVNNKTTWYVRDASGNVMGVYEKEGTASLALRELHLYGSSRLGIYNVNINVEDMVVGLGKTTFIRGNKFFELSNHLGNVLVTVSDKKLAVASTTNPNLIAYYTADVVTANDYYPFGMQMPGRKYSASSAKYRYGFNGKENDNDVKGEGKQQDYGMRIYDPRVGKFLSVDPITKEYPELTPYQFASNRPIDGIDLDGLEFLPFQSSMYQFVISQPTSEVTLSIVYSNIPTKLQNTETYGLKYSAYPPMNSDGTEYDPFKQGIMLFDMNKYNKPNAVFNGTASGTSTNGIESLKGNAIPGGFTNNISADNVNSLGSILGPNGAIGLGQNAWNYLLPFSDQSALIEEAEKRVGWKNSVNAIDKRINNGILPTTGGDVKITPQLRAGIINFLVDGSMDIKQPELSLQAAWYGTQILQKNGMSIQQPTREAIDLTLKAYKDQGGTVDYSGIKNYYDE